MKNDLSRQKNCIQFVSSQIIKRAVIEVDKPFRMYHRLVIGTFDSTFKII